MIVYEVRFFYFFVVRVIFLEIVFLWRNYFFVRVYWFMERVLVRKFCVVWGFL